MPTIWETLGLGLIGILLVQMIRMYLWVLPVDEDSDTVFTSWPYFLAMFAVVIALPSRIAGAWEPMRIWWGVMILAVATVAHLLYSGRILWRAWRHRGHYRMFWF